MNSGHFYPSDEDRDVFDRIIAAVRNNTARYREHAAALDRDYTTQAIRARWADNLRQIRAAAELHAQWSHKPQHNSPKPRQGRLSRAYQRKHVPQLGCPVPPFESMPGPVKRSRDAYGKLQQPDIALRKRFALAFRDTFEDDRDLTIHPVEERSPVEARRVLLAWLRLDPNRGNVAQITEFQQLRNTSNKYGLAPLIACDDAEMLDWDKALFLCADGGMKRDAPSWIKKARGALEFLGSQAFPPVQATASSEDVLQKAQKQPTAHDEASKTQDVPSKPDAPQIAQGGMAWQDAMKRAEKHVKAHDGAFPSVKRLAEIVGCSRPTMRKAINNSTYLSAREAEKSQSARSEPLTDIAIEQGSEQAWREDAPEREDQDAELDELIAQQKADQARNDRQEKAAKKGRT